jgi:hypothetical protein
VDKSLAELGHVCTLSFQKGKAVRLYLIFIMPTFSNTYTVQCAIYRVSTMSCYLFEALYLENTYNFCATAIFFRSLLKCDKLQ